MVESVKNLSEKLSKRGIRPSYQRIKVLEYLVQNRCHPTVDQIFNHLIKEIPTLSKSTIYNTVNLFIESDLLKPIGIEDNEVRYDIDTSDHGHFKCESCGKIFDFAIDIENLTTEDLKGFRINDKSVYFKGICPECLKNKKDNKKI